MSAKENISHDGDFSSLGLSRSLMRAIADSGYTEPTPVQRQAIPLVLDGGDVLAAAQTGTGKTAGFTLPILHRLSAAPRKNKAGQPRCLILTPTRELAAQISESVCVYGKHLTLASQVVFGGVNINRQIQALRKPVDILIATPGRLLDLVGQQFIDLSCIEILVLDEADRMCDMGFIHDVRRVIRLLPEQRQTLLFSATFSTEIRGLAKSMLNQPREVSVARRNTASELVQQTVHLVDKPRKRALLSSLISDNQWQQVLVFTKTKHGANRLAEQLGKDGIDALAIHGNKSQAARTRALAQFKSGTTPVLVATDIAARGLDIDQLPQVVNYELPHVPEDYVHRIGRTGRAGSTGQAVSLVDADELKLLRGIEQLIKLSIPKIEVAGHTGHQIAAGSTPVAEPRRPASSRHGKAGQGSSGNSRKGGKDQGNRAGSNRHSANQANGNRAESSRSGARRSGSGRSGRGRQRTA